MFWLLTLLWFALCFGCWCDVGWLCLVIGLRLVWCYLLDLMLLLGLGELFRCVFRFDFVRLFCVG